MCFDLTKFDLQDFLQDELQDDISDETACFLVNFFMAMANALEFKLYSQLHSVSYDERDDSTPDL